MEAKTCSTCGETTQRYETIHSAIVCNICEEGMYLVDQGLLLADGKNYWVICAVCHAPAPFRSTQMKAVLAVQNSEEFEKAHDDTYHCVVCQTSEPRVVNDYPADIDDVRDMLP